MNPYANVLLSCILLFVHLRYQRYVLFTLLYFYNNNYYIFIYQDSPIFSIPALSTIVQLMQQSIKKYTQDNTNVTPKYNIDYNFDIFTDLSTTSSDNDDEITTTNNGDTTQIIIDSDNDDDTTTNNIVNTIDNNTLTNVILNNTTNTKDITINDIKSDSDSNSHNDIHDTTAVSIDETQSNSALSTYLFVYRRITQAISSGILSTSFIPNIRDTSYIYTSSNPFNTNLFTRSNDILPTTNSSNTINTTSDTKDTSNTIKDTKLFLYSSSTNSSIDSNDNSLIAANDENINTSPSLSRSNKINNTIDIYTAPSLQIPYSTLLCEREISHLCTNDIHFPFENQSDDDTATNICKAPYCGASLPSKRQLYIHMLQHVNEDALYPAIAASFDCNDNVKTN